MKMSELFYCLEFMVQLLKLGFLQKEACDIHCKDLYSDV